MDIDGGNEPLLAKKQVSEPNEAENIKGRDGNSSVQHEASISTTSVFFGLVWQGMDFDRLDDQIRRDVADAAVAQQECNNDKIVQREERVSFLDMSIAFFSRLLFGGYLFALLGVVSDVMVFYDDYSQSNFCQVLLDLSILMYGMHASYCRQRKHLAILASVELLLAILGGNASNIEDIHFCLAIANMFLIGVMSKVVTKRLAGLRYVDPSVDDLPWCCVSPLCPHLSAIAATGYWINGFTSSSQVLVFLLFLN